MSEKNNLFPAFENFRLEEADIDVEINVGAPEEVEAEISDATEEVAEVVETESEVQEEATEAEEMLRTWDRMDAMVDYLKEHGADRAFMQIFNKHNELAIFGISVASYESFDSRGDISSADTQACIASLEEASEGVWAWIKRMCAKIRGFFQKLIEGLRQRLSSIDGSIGRLRKALEGRKDEPTRLGEAKIKVYGKASLDKAWISKSILDKFSSSAAQAKNAAASGTLAAEAFEGGIKNMEEIIKEAQKSKKDERSKVLLSDVKFGDLKSMLDDVAKKKAELTTFTAALDKAKEAAAAYEKAADQMKTRRDDDGTSRKNARAGVAIVNKMVKIGSSIVAHNEWVLRQELRTIGQRIARGTVKSDY